MTLPPRGLVVFLGTLVGLACGPQAAPPKHLAPAFAPPIGAVAYQRLLQEEAQLEWTPAELAAVAAAEAAGLRAALDHTARQIDPTATSWRPVFAALRAHHGADAEAILERYRQAAERAREFVTSRGFVTVPPGPPLRVELVPAVIRPGHYPLVAYLGDRLAVALPPRDPNARLADHDDASLPAWVAHEAYPGHHVAFLVRRAPKPEPTPRVLELAIRHTRNRFHAEGWATYGELLMLRAGFYQEDPAAQLGALRLLYLRAVRARLDVELHTAVRSPEDAAATLAEELLLSPEAARAEVASHFAEPGLKASYLVGALQLVALRQAVGAGNTDFEERAFHDRVLTWPMPIPALAAEVFAVPWPGPSRAGDTLTRFLAGSI